VAFIEMNKLLMADKEIPNVHISILLSDSDWETVLVCNSYGSLTSVGEGCGEEWTVMLG
jgi:hypothetical protein